jgi:hypothetical protein
MNLIIDVWLTVNPGFLKLLSVNVGLGALA